MNNSESILLIVIVQLIVIIAASRLFGALFRRIGQPQVCGEIAAGLILGPSFFGGLFPGSSLLGVGCLSAKGVH